MTKSVINALIGILTQQGLVTPSFPAPVPEWRAPTDPRREIEVEHLMRMTSGLALDETNSGFDASSQMVYLHDDMAGFAAKAALIAEREKRVARNPHHDAPFGAFMLAAIGPEPGAVIGIEGCCGGKIHPVLMQEATAADDAVVQVEQSESCPVPGAG